MHRILPPRFALRYDPIVLPMHVVRSTSLVIHQGPRTYAQLKILKCMWKDPYAFFFFSMQVAHHSPAELASRTSQGSNSYISHLTVLIQIDLYS